MGENPRGVVPTLGGNMDVVIEKGHVRKGTVIPRILALLNLPSVLGNKVDLKNGFPFNKATATFKLEDGVITSKNVIVDSPIMKMTTAGEYDMVTDELDLVAAVSPFGRYSAFLKKIPLFGRILAGESKRDRNRNVSSAGIIDGSRCSLYASEVVCNWVNRLISIGFRYSQKYDYAPG